MSMRTSLLVCLVLLVLLALLPVDLSGLGLPYPGQPVHGQR